MKVLLTIVLLLAVSTTAFRSTRDLQYNTTYGSPRENTGSIAWNERDTRWDAGSQIRNPRISTTPITRQSRETSVLGTELRYETPRVYGNDWTERPYRVGEVYAPVAEYEVLKPAPEVQRRVAVVEVPEAERRVKSTPVYDYGVVQRAEVVPEREYRTRYPAMELSESVIRQVSAPEYVKAPIAQYKATEPIRYAAYSDVVPEIHHAVRQEVIEKPELVRRVAAAPEIEQVTRVKRYKT